MARKTLSLTIEKEGRDQGKIFILTEMSAWLGFDWASRIFFALMNAGVDIPIDFIQSGMAGIAALSEADFAKFIFKMLSKIPHYIAKPILDDLVTCAKIQPGDNAKIVRDLVENDIEEISTILTIQKEVFNLHFGFFGSGG